MKSFHEISLESSITGEKYSSIYRIIYTSIYLALTIAYFFFGKTSVTGLVFVSVISFLLYIISLFSLLIVKKTELHRTVTYFTIAFDILGGLTFSISSLLYYSGSLLAPLVVIVLIIALIIVMIFRLKPAMILGYGIVLCSGMLIFSLYALFILEQARIALYSSIILVILMFTSFLVYILSRYLIAILEKNLVTEDLLRSSRRLRMTLEIVEASIVSLSSFVANLENISEKLSKGARNQLSSIEEISKAAENLQKSMEGISTSSEISENTIKRTADLSNNGNLILKRVIEEILGIHEVADKMVTSLDLIDEIADQTNLLSLNATIEASRAGEEATGFSVIAEEIRELAERSSETAAEIGKLVKEIERVIFSGGESSKEAGKIFDRINKDLNVYSNFVHDLHVAVQNQLSSNREVTKAIEMIERVTRENTVMAGEVNKILSDIKSEVARLKDLVTGKMSETASLSTISKK